MHMNKLVRPARYVAAGVVMFFTVVALQFYTMMERSDQARQTAVSLWLSDNPNGSQVVERYQMACEHGGAIGAPSLAPRLAPLTFAECGAMIGSDSLVKALTIANDSVVVPAPLRWL